MLPFSRTLGAGTHQLAKTDLNIAVDTSSGAVTLILPLISGIVSEAFRQGFSQGNLLLTPLQITDVSNNASVNNIIINPSTGDYYANNIGGVVININNGSVNLKPASDNSWNVVFSEELNPPKAVILLGSGTGSSYRCGNNNNSSGVGSTVSGGCFNSASGYYSVVNGGKNNSVSGAYSSASGYCNFSSGLYSSVSGICNCLYGNNSTTSGYRNQLSGENSSVSGGYNTVSGIYSSVSGYSNLVSGFYSNVSGGNNTLSGSYSSVSGSYNIVSGNFSNAFGCNLIASCNLTTYANNFCACDSFYTATIPNGCMVCSSSGKLIGFTGIPLMTDYGSFYDTTSQNTAGMTEELMKFNTTSFSNNVSIVNDGLGDPTKILISSNGIFNIQFSAQLKKLSGGSSSVTIYIYLIKNGTKVPDTNTQLTISNTQDYLVASWNFFETINSGNFLQLGWYATTNKAEIHYNATPVVGLPEIPSIILTVNRVA